MLKLLVISCVLAAANAGLYGYLNPHSHLHASHYIHPAPKAVETVQEYQEPEPVGAAPYEFGYEIVDEEGNRQSRKEAGDATGAKKGSYGIALVDGRKRQVEYIANGDGFRAIVRSNEQGTDPQQDPADVQQEPLGPVIEVVKKHEPVVVKVAPSYVHGHAHGGHGYGHGYGHGHGHSLGHGYGNLHGHGHSHGYHGAVHGGGHSTTYSKRYEVPTYHGHHGHHGHYGQVAPSYAYGQAYGHAAPSYSYGNSYFPGYANKLW